MNITALQRYFLRVSGLGRGLWSLRPNGLYCFNFHRIGDWRESEYDPCVFSCSAKDLECYIDFIRQHFRVIGLPELLEMVKQPDIALNEPLAMITFDDGYRDNYECALPILKKAKIPATFFITTSLIESDDIPWWDEIAWHIRQLTDSSLKLSSWKSAVEFTSGMNARDRIRAVLHRFKNCSVPIEQQLEELRRLSGKRLDSDAGRSMFMDWQQLKALVSAGMSIGAHSHSHQIFSGLSNQELKFELSHSKALLEEHLGGQVVALSYPVGNMSTFSSGMFEEIERQGYQLAFSFSAMRNVHLRANRFQMGRFPVDVPFNKDLLIANCLTAASL